MDLYMENSRTVVLFFLFSAVGLTLDPKKNNDVTAQHLASVTTQQLVLIFWSFGIFLHQKLFFLPQSSLEAPQTKLKVSAGYLGVAELLGLRLLCLTSSCTFLLISSRFIACF